jgi:PD-(D/E)XK nuclease superfamily
VILSASQLKTAQLCRRKRYLERVAKLPTPKSRGAVFGTILHGCLERFLEADHLGRDKRTKQPVDLFPEGWDSVVTLEIPSEKDGNKPKTEEVFACDVEPDQIRWAVRSDEASAWESATIKKLVARAIEDGVVERRAGGRVERSFLVSYPNLGASLTGFIDYCDDRSADIDDHKTTKNARYLLSKEKLKFDLQMNLYSAVRLQEIAETGSALPELVALTHNGFIRGTSPDEELRGVKPQPSAVRKTTVRLPATEVVDYWNQTIVPLIRQVVEDAQLTDPFAIPDPDAGACSAYGGCPFLGICTKKETTKEYAARVASFQDQATLIQQQNNPGETMSLKEKLAALRGGKVAPVASPTPAVQEAPPQPAASVATPPPTAVAQTPTPWAMRECSACKGTGVSSAGTPCAVCAMKNKTEFGKYLIELNADGDLYWVHSETGVEGIYKIAKKVAPTEVKEARPPAVAKVEEPLQFAAVTEQFVEAKAEAEKQEPVEVKAAIVEVAGTPAPEQPRRRGRPPGSKNKPRDGAPGATQEQVDAAAKAVSMLPDSGLILAVGVTVKGPLASCLVTADEVLADLLVDGKPYFQCDTWKRRDWLRNNSEAIASSLGDSILQLLVDNPDSRELMGALIPHAVQVWAPIN